MLKRAFDIVVSAIGLVIALPLILVLSLMIRMDSPGPAIFRQTRIGRSFRPFTLFKLRSMRADNRGAEITVGQDARITRLGGVIRALKLDELPQLWNVLRGDMSLVGPRPEVSAYVELYRKDFEEILRVRPGITDAASIKYRHESELLSTASDPEAFYRDVILPDKIRLSKDYASKANCLLDLSLIFETLIALGRDRF